MSSFQSDLKAIVGVDDLLDQINTLTRRVDLLAKSGTARQGDVLVAGFDGVGAGGGTSNDPTTANGVPSVRPITSTDISGALNGSGTQLGDTLDSMQGLTDCATGKTIQIDENGQAAPPYGWVSSSVPGDQGFYRGTTWGGLNRPTVSQAVADFAAALAAAFGDKRIIERVGNTIVNPDGSGTTYFYIRTVKYDDGSPIPVYLQPVTEAQINGSPCLIGSANCPATEPSLPTQWPVANKFQLIRGSDGVLRPDSHDPNVPVNYSDGVSKVDFCYGNGQHGSREALANGGFTYYETDGSGNPINNALIYDANAKLIAKIDSADLVKYR